ncbi:tubulin binding cofactor A [Phlegmacium glaucopus]|nr:tubulin binding cofactor A [Phlegmacium glaucopus]
MSDIAAIRRQLRIKSGVVQRLTKENGLYRKEADQLEAKKNKFIADGAEHWDISNATKMTEESKKMIQDTFTRLKKAAEELAALITSAKKETGLINDEELIKAEDILKVAQDVELEV